MTLSPAEKGGYIAPTPSTFPAWIYDGSEIPDPLGFGERAVAWLRMLKHPKSGKAFQLDPWQERIVRRIYGPRHEDGSRIVKTVVILVPRGNRKTSLAAALEALHTIGPERVPGGEVISAASDRKQARIAYEELRGLPPHHVALILAMDAAWLEAAHRRTRAAPDGTKTLPPVSKRPISAALLDAVLG